MIMDFSLSFEQKMCKDVARKFAEVEIAPRIEEMEKTRRTPGDLIKKMRDLNLYGIQYPEKYGGVGSSFLEYCMILEEISRVYCSIGGHIAVNSLCTGTIYDFGTEAQRKEYLPDLICGGSVGSFAFTEPDTGSDPRAIRTTALREENEWVINGNKTFITNSTLPGYMAVFCKDTEKGGKITNIIVPKFCKGYTVGKHYDKLGMHGMEVADVFFDNVRVPLENTTGGEKARGRGFDILTQEVAGGKTGVSAQCVGMAQGALDEAVMYAKKRTQRGKPIGSFQTIQWIIGEMAAEVEAARYMTYATAYEKSCGLDITAKSARARLFSSQVAHRAASNAMQVMGAFGYIREFRIERIFRDVKLSEIYEGVNEIQRIISASALLR
jgi:alkylation response protein AidB-like acyl-CoA dehydrogenase